MKLNTPTSPHIHADISIRKMMSRVLMALVPAMICYTWFFGWGLLINMGIGIATALTCELLMLKARQRPVHPFLTDGSVIVTAVLLAFCIPPLAPWWLMVLGVSFSVIVAKHLYGGLGYNPFNPGIVRNILIFVHGYVKIDPDKNALSRNRYVFDGYHGFSSVFFIFFFLR